MWHKKSYGIQQHHEIENLPKAVTFSVFKGLTMALLSGLCYAISSAVVKQMTNFHPGQLAVYRNVALMIFSFPEAIKCRENLLGPKNFRFLLLYNAILTTTSVFLGFIAFRYLPLGESAVIVQSYPIYVAVAARIFLKEPLKIFQLLAIFVSVAGMVFITKIPQTLFLKSVVYTMESIYGLLSAVGSMIFLTWSIVLIRKVKSIHHSITMFSYGWISILETVILTAIVGNFRLHNCGLQGLYIIIIGFLSYAGYSLMIMALQCEMAGPVSTMRAASNIASSFVLQILLFHDIPDLYSSLGAVLVGVSIFFFGLQKWVSSLSEESPYKKKLSWFLK